jgi:hypothetical protein
MSDEEPTALNGAGDPKMVHVLAIGNVLHLEANQEGWVPADHPELDALLALDFLRPIGPNGEVVEPPPPRTSCCGR